MSAPYAIYPVNAPLNNPILVTVMVEFVLYMQYVFVYRVLNLGIKGLLYIGMFQFCIYLTLLYLLKNSDVGTYWTMHNLFAFTPFWVIGALSAHIVVFNDKVKYIKPSFLLVLILLWVMIVQFNGFHYTLKPIIFIFMACITGIILSYLAANSKKTVFNSENYFSKIITLVALMTFSFYLTHDLVKNLININNFNFYIYPEIVNFMLAVLIGFIFYLLIEKPFHLLARRF